MIAAQGATRGAGLLSKTRSKLRFWISYPFVMGAYRWRQRMEWRRIVPRLWLSQGDILTKDLDLYEGPEPFDLKFIDDFAKARDDTLATIKKQTIVSALIFLFLFSNYLSIAVDINIAGFSLKYGAGLSEGLLLISNLLSCYTLILQGNCYLLDSTIKFAIANGLPLELQTIYLIKYFPHEYFGGYRPSNLPHITPAPLTSKIAIGTSIFFLVLLVITAVAFAGCNFFLLLHHLWFQPAFGVWSRVLFVFILACGACSTMYVIITRLKMPYNDYTINHELQVLEQENPQQHRVRLNEVYGSYNARRREMIQRGYLKGP